jgi:hypothetical protein
MELLITPLTLQISIAIPWPWKPTMLIFPLAARGTCAVARRAPAHDAGCITEALQKIALPRRTGTNDSPVRLTGIQSSRDPFGGRFPGSGAIQRGYRCAAEPRLEPSQPGQMAQAG